MTYKEKPPAQRQLDGGRPGKPDLTTSIIHPSVPDVNTVVLGYDPEGYPIVAARHCILKRGRLSIPLAQFFCPYCGIWHIHGGGGSDRGAGHRVAHCIHPRSPIKPKGYILQIVGDVTPEWEKAEERRWRKHAKAWQREHPEWWERL
jgi:hypothetical protein